MSTQTQKGNGAQSATTQQKNEKGLAVVKQLPAPQVNPFEERKMKVAALQRKVVQVQKFEDIKQHLNEFVLGADDNDQQTLEIKDKQRRSWETANPVIIGEVIAYIQERCEKRIPELKAEILQVTI